MTTRAAFIALGVTLAILPAAARSEPAPARMKSGANDMSGGFDLDADARDGTAARRANAFAPLPPRRPDRPVALELPAPAGASADMAQAPQAGRPVTMVLPPLRPSVAFLDDAPTAKASSASSPAIPAPPPRPEEVAPATAGVETASVAIAPVEIAQVEIAPVEIALLPPARPAFPSDPDPVETGSIAPPTPTRSLFGSLFATPAPTPPAPAIPAATAKRGGGHDGIDDLIARHASLNDVPEDLVHRVVIRESRYNPRAVGRGGALGLMQIKHATARALGYGGPANGLLDADTNLTYAVKYLAGAYRTAGGNYDRAVSYYARGYYYASKRLRLDEADAVPEGRRRRPQAEAVPARTTRAASLAVADNGRIERTSGPR